MRLLHTADLHLGKVFYETSLLPDQIIILDQIRAVIVDQAIDVLILAGDIYDRSIPPPEAVVAFSQFLADLRTDRPQLHILIIPGNHDSAARLAYGREIFQTANIHLADRPERSHQPLTLTVGAVTADFFLLPFLVAGSLSRPGEAGEVVSLRSQSELVEQAVKLMAAAMTPDRPTFLVAHLFTAGGQASDSERLFAGTAELVPPELFDGFTYTALGHLHRPQNPAERVRYSGSPLAYSFSEADQPKSLTRLDLDAAGHLTITLLPLTPPHPVARLRGTWADIVAPGRFEDLRDAYLEISLTDDYLPPQPMAALRQKFPLAMNLRLEVREEKILTALDRTVLKTSRSVGEDFAAFYQQIGHSDDLATDQALFASLVAEVQP